MFESMIGAFSERIMVWISYNNVLGCRELVHMSIEKLSVVTLYLA